MENILSWILVGGERELVFKNIRCKYFPLKIDNNYEQIKYKLENNSLFIMAGASQKYFTHEVPCVIQKK